VTSIGYMAIGDMAETGTGKVATAARALQSYEEAFGALEKTSSSASSWLRELRSNGFARFIERGFPTLRDEDWRFTNIAPISQTPFHLIRNGSHGHHAPSRIELEAYQLPGAASELVFIDGRFAPALSSPGHLPQGASAVSLAGQIARDANVLEAYLGRYLDMSRDAFSALNTAFLEDGAYVHVTKGTIVEAPIHLLFVSTAHDDGVVTHPRNLIVADENSQVTVIEEYVSLGHGAGKNSAALCNTATELIAGDHSVVSHIMVEREDVQDFNVSTLRIQQGRAADVSSHSVLAGGGIVRNNVHPVLAGEGGECLINGLFVGSGHQHLDNYMLVEHASPRCGSRQFYNGILADRAHGVFHGRIIVHKDAQKTDAKQTNRNLLLSDTAQIDTKPQLEIYADDVKCTHGATIGQIEEGALFYLRSRGIDEASAHRLLLVAFASECLDRMKEGAARTHVEKLINECLRPLSHLSHVAAPQVLQDKDSR
jgi:Fe-S cluster assembly protein SufD